MSAHGSHVYHSIYFASISVNFPISTVPICFLLIDISFNIYLACGLSDSKHDIMDVAVAEPRTLLVSVGHLCDLYVLYTNPKFGKSFGEFV